MQKWEYLFVIGGGWGWGGEPYVLGVRGKVLEDRKEHLPLYEFTNQLGEEGWELVSAEGNTAHFGNLIFKRPKE